MRIINSGQSLVEFLVSFIIIFLLFLAIIEISRVLSFKIILQNFANEIVFQASMNPHFIIKDYQLSQSELDKFKSLIEKEISKNIGFSIFRSTFGEESLNYIRYNFRVYFINSSQKQSSDGLALQINFCFPLLFLPNLSPSNGRNCLGEFLKQGGTVSQKVLRLRVASYFSKSASSQIYKKGLALPKKIDGLDHSYLYNKQALIFESQGFDDYRKQVLDFLYKKEFKDNIEIFYARKK